MIKSKMLFLCSGNSCRTTHLSDFFRSHLAAAEFVGPHQ
jgi:protein-tyrosine-phosphatase